jgi:hypothetical protein
MFTKRWKARKSRFILHENTIDYANNTKPLRVMLEELTKLTKHRIMKKE